MRIFKKVLFFTLALMPLLSILIGLFSLKGTGITPTFQGGELVTDGTNVMTFEFVEGSIEELLFGSESINFGAEESGFSHVFLSFLGVLSSVGVPVNYPLMVWTMYYIGYLLMIELMFILFDLFMFIPRKCKEVFE